MSEEERKSYMIGSACEIGDAIMLYLVDEGLVPHNVLFDQSREDTEEDPSGFTEVGRDLFEFVYNQVVDL